MMSWIVVPHNSCVNVLTPSISEWGVYRDNQLKARSLGWALIQNAGVLIKKGNLHSDTHTQRMPCEDESRDQGDSSTNQDTIKIVSKPLCTRGRDLILSHSPQKEPTLMTLISDFQFPELWDNKVLLFKPLGLWYFVTGAVAN